ncbi:MAG: hypothetical protein PHC54_05965 [Candidatus Omnitrophica bacterium]|nr:hypothetical protein [Candidatus Omnitrophota bacterium]MDD5592785.1 hypothetical protein [Candidatus Omnitrophota bacterium]
MFYAETPDNSQLRFGDVVKGFILAASAIEKPMVMDEEHNYKVDINFPNLCVVLSPCCTISQKTKNDGIIAISPLKPIRVDFFDNPYFKEDLMRINKMMEPEQSLAPDIWTKLPPEEQEKRKAIGISYALLELFVYQEHEYFPEYIITNAKRENSKTRFFMIDFRDNFKVNCEALKGDKGTLSDIKLLQLSANARKELRDKIADFYGRTPNEDKVLLVE